MDAIHKRQTVVSLLSTILVVFWLTSCNLPSQSQSLLTWIDQPLDGAQLPLAPLILQAHAADADGITKIEFLVFDSLIGSIPTGGSRLEEASIEWTPPGPGIYTINVRAIDALGNTNTRSPASVQITITDGTPSPSAALIPASGTCSAESLVPPLLLSPEDGAVVTGEPLLAWTYPDANCDPDSYAVDISSDSTFSDISLGFGTLDYSETSRQWPLPAGQCYFWRVRTFGSDDEGPPSPAWSFCLTASTTAENSLPNFTLLQNANCRLGPGTAYDTVDLLTQGASAAIKGRNEDNSWFWIQIPSNHGQCWVSSSLGTASGNWQDTPVIAAPALPITDTPADLASPQISDLSANPTIVSVLTQCGDTPATTIIRARVTDPGGISQVSARVAGVGEFEMTPVGDNYYQVTLGPFGEAGTLSIFVQGQDNAGNTATNAPLTVDVVSCPG